MARVSAMLTEDDDGNPTAEYWHGDKKLTLYCEPTGTRYCRSWNLPKSTEFEEGELVEAGDIHRLLRWLLKEPG